jgi:hypothetical protein
MKARIILIVGSLLLLVFSSTLSGAKPPRTGGPPTLPTIESVIVDMDSEPIKVTLYGRNLLRGDELPAIQFLGIDELTVETNPAPKVDMIVAHIDFDLPEEAGDYQLMIITSEEPPLYDTYDLTIGAVGPQGEPGPAGADGSSCSVSQGDGSATVTCEDGSEATVHDGADGTPGDTGPQGPPGVLGFYTVEGDSVTLGTNHFRLSVAACDNGDKVTGGGFNKTWYECFILSTNKPSNDEVEWLAGGRNGCEFEVTVTSFARCADFDPPHQD